jgi:hypothetical protein
MGNLTGYDDGITSAVYGYDETYRKKGNGVTFELSNERIAGSRKRYWSRVGTIRDHLHNHQTLDLTKSKISAMYAIALFNHGFT